jgi:hypothetical protein
MMAKSSNQPAEQIPVSGPRPLAPDAPNADAPEPRPLTRVPFVWRLVFMFWVVCMTLMILNELSSYIAKIFK